ncbi:MAG: hypothetical protein JWQ90_4584 [Hydrocarboniphaga sp.]|uniref:hypothetical protein n=1 Tax=Hydrocarboniphaga sp. TaxID=2033016 RepID=UPI00261775A3|nr:hypothetical protein [Hydrocarboniphaga sp.]MDB5972134.1 hypothetical protein [Hydrocarboniphaga sp.]
MSKLSRRTRPDALLICKKCLKKQRRDCDVDGVELDDWLKQQLRALDGEPLPMAKCKCLDLCPDDGVVLALGGKLAGKKPLHVIKNGDKPERVIRWLGQRGRLG